MQTGLYVAISSQMALEKRLNTIADNIANGVSSYEKVKLVGIIVAIVGFLVMANLHTLILSLFVNLVFNR